MIRKIKLREKIDPLKKKNTGNILVQEEDTTIYEMLRPYTQQYVSTERGSFFSFFSSNRLLLF